MEVAIHNKRPKGCVRADVNAGNDRRRFLFAERFTCAVAADCFRLPNCAAALKTHQPGFRLGNRTCGRRISILTLIPGTLREDLDLRIGGFLADAIKFLDLVRQLIALAGNALEVVVRECAPLLFHSAFELSPVPSMLCQLIAISCQT